LILLHLGKWYLYSFVQTIHELQEKLQVFFPPDLTMVKRRGSKIFLLVNLHGNSISLSTHHQPLQLHYGALHSAPSCVMPNAKFHKASKQKLHFSSMAGLCSHNIHPCQKKYFCFRGFWSMPMEMALL